MGGTSVSLCVNFFFFVRCLVALWLLTWMDIGVTGKGNGRLKSFSYRYRLYK